LVYIVLAGLLLWFVVAAKGKWFLKLVAILGTLAFSFFAYNALNSRDGWPAPISLPQRALFISGEVIQPTGTDPGKIYLWLVPPHPHVGLFGYSPSNLEPRAYRIPYSLQTQAAVEHAQQLTAEGQQVELRLRVAHHPVRNRSGHGPPNSQHRRGSGGRGSTSKSQAQQNIGVYVLPKSAPPQKD
jgi:hypothetical protein